jgi:hypothetical protein
MRHVVIDIMTIKFKQETRLGILYIRATIQITHEKDK